jgi:HK97 family phage major capsid protein
MSADLSTRNIRTGQLFVRHAKALGVARGDHKGAIAYAAGQNWRDREQIEVSLKAPVTATGTDDQAAFSPAAFDFAEFLRPQTAIGKLIGLRHAPARVRLISATAGSGAYWAGERAPRPISRATFTGAVVEPLAVSAILVTTLELLRSSAGRAESTLSRDLASAARAAMDSAFCDWTSAGSPGAKPAGIANGATPIHSAGSTLANIDSDLGLLLQALSDAGSDLTFATWIMRPKTALFLARLRGSAGALAHPAMTANGGTLLGLPCITTAHVPVSGTTGILLLDPSEILVVDDGGGTIEVGEQTALQMSDGPGAGAQSLVSMWQTESVALKINRYLNWQRCRDGMAQVLDQVSY